MWLAQLDTARRWRAVGRPLEDVDAFVGLRLGPNDIAVAASLGLGEDDVLRWSPVTTDPESAAGWRATGWTVGEARELAYAGYDPANAA